MNGRGKRNPKHLRSWGAVRRSSWSPILRRLLAMVPSFGGITAPIERVLGCREDEVAAFVAQLDDRAGPVVGPAVVVAVTDALMFEARRRESVGDRGAALTAYQRAAQQYREVGALERSARALECAAGIVFAPALVTASRGALLEVESAWARARASTPGDGLPPLYHAPLAWLYLQHGRWGRARSLYVDGLRACSRRSESWEFAELALACRLGTLVADLGRGDAASAVGTMERYASSPRPRAAGGGDVSAVLIRLQLAFAHALDQVGRSRDARVARGRIRRHLPNEPSERFHCILSIVFDADARGDAGQAWTWYRRAQAERGAFEHAAHLRAATRTLAAAARERGDEVRASFWEGVGARVDAPTTRA